MNPNALPNAVVPDANVLIALYFFEIRQNVLPLSPVPANAVR